MRLEDETAASTNRCGVLINNCLEALGCWQKRDGLQVVLTTVTCLGAKVQTDPLIIQIVTNLNSKMRLPALRLACSEANSE